ncbi:MAG TPA: TIR domain-containing protein, partial [Pyrinomonadaceae bacterium]|nr:TIR domain-containing protein [Pyrinomonadaceae bacterium]
MTFKAFISYSHAGDGELAPAVQRALHRLAKPWYRLRAMRVFRDQTNLSVSPGLWNSIESALRNSEFFLLMASPPAARSPWVEKEVDWWLTQRSAQTFLILLTDGQIAWDGAARDFDWAATTALPARLSKAFAEEPLYIDLRWAKRGEQLSARHSQFRAAILEVAATLLNRPKDELDGEDVRQYRRTKRIAWAGVAALAGLLAAALLAAYLATQQRDLAVSRALVARAEAVLPLNPELSLLLAQEAVRVRADEQAEYALREVLARHPLRVIHHGAPGSTVVAEFVGPGLILAAEPGKSAAVWGAADGRRAAELSATAGDTLVASTSLAGTPAGPLVALPTGEAAFTVYDPKLGRAVSELPGSYPRFSRRGNVLVADDGGGSLRQWEVPSLRERRPPLALPEGYALRDVSADGDLLFLAEPMEVSAALVVAAGSGRTLAKLPTRVLREGDVFSTDGGLVLTERMSGGLELWDSRSGRKARDLERSHDIGWTSYVAFGPDGELLVTGNRQGELHVWRVATGEFSGTLAAHRNDILKIAFSPDGKTMLTAAADGTACLWDTGSMRVLVRLGGKGDDAWDVSFAPDGAHFLTTHADGTVRVWHREVWYPSLTLPGEPAAVSDDGLLVLAAERDEQIVLRDARTGQLKVAFEESAGEVEAVALSARARLAAAAADGRPVTLWDAESGRVSRRLAEASAGATALAFSPDENRIATGHRGGEVRLWDAHGGGLLGEWPGSDAVVTKLVFTPDGETCVVARSGGPAQVRSVRTGEVLMEVEAAGEDVSIEDVSLSADGSLLLAAEGKVVHAWDVAGRRRLYTLAGHTDEVSRSAFSRDGRFIVTGSGYLHARGMSPEDGNEVRLWDAGSGRELLSYRSASMSVVHVSFGPDDTTIFASGSDGAVRRYRCEVCMPLPALTQLAASRTARGLSDEERARYVPDTSVLGWVWNYLPSRTRHATA